MLACILVVTLPCLLFGRSSDVVLPTCQEATRRPRRSTVCQYPPSGSSLQTNPANNTECTDAALCQTLSLPLLAPSCDAPSETVNTSISDGVVNRSFYVTYPGGCEKPTAGWPFLLFFGFDINGVRSTRSLAQEVLFIKEQLLSQGIAFAETSMYWNDTYDQRECNSFELSEDIVSSGTCRSCEKDAEPLCGALRNWFTCGNWAGARDIVMMRNMFSGWHSRSATSDLDITAMAYLGWSVGGHMVSRMIQLSAQSSVYPVPKCAVMISGASYQCYSCPATPKNGDPSDDFERCNWYAQGYVANDSIVKNAVKWPCGSPFSPFIDSRQNKWGVCPGHTLYPSNTTWWQMEVGAQAADDPLLTEEAWDSCSKSFYEHPPVLVAQPWEDSNAYWNVAANYYEVLTRQSGGRGCRMYAGGGVHGPRPIGNQATVNFVLSYLVERSGLKRVIV